MRQTANQTAVKTRKKQVESSKGPINRRAAELHAFLRDSGVDTGGTSWTPCFIRNRVKCRSAQCLCRQPRRRERRRKRCQSDEAGGKNSFSLRIRCRGQLAMRARAVFLTQQPAGTWSKAALTTSVFIQFVFGGEGNFTWSGYLGTTVSFPVQPLPPPTLLTHPNNSKEETHFLMSILCRGFISKNKQMTANQSFFAEDGCFR